MYVRYLIRNCKFFYAFAMDFVYKTFADNLSYAKRTKSILMLASF